MLYRRNRFFCILMIICTVTFFNTVDNDIYGSASVTTESQKPNYASLLHHADSSHICLPKTNESVSLFRQNSGRNISARKITKLLPTVYSLAKFMPFGNCWSQDDYRQNINHTYTKITIRYIHKKDGKK